MISYILLMQSLLFKKKLVLPRNTIVSLYLLLFKIGVISNWASINIKGSIISNHAKGGIIIKSH